MATIIVPAHNEAAVIKDCLDSVISQAGVDHVIVACNGCTDDTAAIVRTHFPDVHCLDLEKPSKPNAMNMAEERAKELGIVYPVFYIDADTRLGDNAVSTIVEALRSGPHLLAAPTPVFDTSQSSWLVKQYYKTWVDMPYNKEGVIATCSFVLTEEGRKRFGPFIEVLSDDGYVRGHFKESEFGNIPGAEIFIRVPSDLRSVMKIKSRARLSNIDLEHRNLCPVSHTKNYGSSLLRMLFSRNLVSTSMYILITLGMRGVARYRLWKGDFRWTRDLSTRVAE